MIPAHHLYWANIDYRQVMESVHNPMNREMDEENGRGTCMMNF